MKKSVKGLRGTISVVIFFFALTSIMCALSNASAQTKPIRLTAATTSVGSPPYLIISNFAEAAKKGLPPGSSINVESSATTANAARIGAGTLDVGYVNIIDAVLAIQGKPPFKEKAEKIRLLCGLTPPETEEFVFVVGKDTGLRSIPEIKEKKFPLTLAEPMKGSGSELLTRMVLGAYGITYDDITSWGGKVIFTSFAEQRTLFKDGRVQASAAIAPYPHPGWTEIFTFRKDVVFLPIDKKEVLEELAKSGIIEKILKKGHYGITDKDISTVASPAFLGVRADLPDDIVTDLLKGALGNIDLIRKSHKTMEQFSPEKAFSYASPVAKIVPFHPAAEKYFKKILGK